MLTTDLGGGVVKTHSYDFANRLKTFVRTTSGIPSSSFSYGYAPSGERILKTDQLAGSTTAFMYDGPDVVTDYAVPAAGTYASLQSYLQGLGIDSKFAHITAGGATVFYNNDALGTVHQLVDTPQLGTDATVLDTQLTTAWGEDLLGSSALTRYHFTQREHDPESDSLHYRARTYFPGLGRFGQKDPLRTSFAGMSAYHYARNNPSTRIDPLGLEDLISIPSRETSARVFGFHRGKWYWMDIEKAVEHGARTPKGENFVNDFARGEQAEILTPATPGQIQLLESNPVARFFTDNDAFSRQYQIFARVWGAPSLEEVYDLQNRVLDDDVGLIDAALQQKLDNFSRGVKELERIASGDLTWEDAQKAVFIATAIAFHRSISKTGGSPNAPLIRQNRVRGLSRAAEVAETLKEAGFDVIEKEITVNTPMRQRRYDLVIRRKDGTYHGVEVKSGGASRDAGQLSKDRYVNQYGAEAVGENAIEQGVDRVSSSVTIFAR
jgi:RHS repeat-associated protein